MVKEQVATLNSYGIILAAASNHEPLNRHSETPLTSDSTDATASLTLGNPYDQQGKNRLYRFNTSKPSPLTKSNTWAHYNLGLLYYELGNIQAAKMNLHRYYRSTLLMLMRGNTCELMESSIPIINQLILKDNGQDNDGQKISAARKTISAIYSILFRDFARQAGYA